MARSVIRRVARFLLPMAALAVAGLDFKGEVAASAPASEAAVAF